LTFYLRTSQITYINIDIIIIYLNPNIYVIFTIESVLTANYY